MRTDSKRDPYIPVFHQLGNRSFRQNLFEGTQVCRRLFEGLFSSSRVVKRCFEGVLTTSFKTSGASCPLLYVTRRLVDRCEYGGRGNGVEVWNTHDTTCSTNTTVNPQDSIRPGRDEIWLIYILPHPLRVTLHCGRTLFFCNINVLWKTTQIQLGVVRGYDVFSYSHLSCVFVFGMTVFESRGTFSLS